MYKSNQSSSRSMSESFSDLSKCFCVLSCFSVIAAIVINSENRASKPNGRYSE